MGLPYLAGLSGLQFNIMHGCLPHARLCARRAKPWRGHCLQLPGQTEVIMPVDFAFFSLTQPSTMEAAGHTWPGKPRALLWDVTPEKRVSSSGPHHSHSNFTWWVLAF